MRRSPLRRIVPAAAVAALAAASVGCGADDERAQTTPFTTPSGTSTPEARTTPRTTSTARTTSTPRTTTTARTTTTPKATAPRTSTTNADPPEEPTAADARLRNTAARHARGRFGVRTLARDVTLRRSRRGPSWAIASGAQGRKLWVVWLRDGTVALATTDTRRFNPPSVPCDVRPAFSEPSC